ncbi:MAG: ATP-binding protein [Burkholderiaceae bacterium]
MTQAALSKASQPHETFWRTLTTFTVTRILIALVLVIYLTLNSRKPLGDTVQLIFWEASIAYVILATAFTGLALFYRVRFLLQLTAQIAGDIAVVSILYVTAGGGKSGLAILYLFPLAGGAILAPLLLSLFFVAAVTLILLGESGYALLQPSADASMSQAGLYGAAFFTAVYAINRLASRLIKQEGLAAERGIELRSQEAINRLVIADMGDGVLVIRGDGSVMTVNPAAERMLGLSMSQRARQWKLSDHVTLTPIADAYYSWLNRTVTPVVAGDEDSASSFVLIKPSEASAPLSAAHAWASRHDLATHLKLRFARVEGPHMPQDRTVIFLQDVSEIDNQAQQLKLASMGRLTASIAHEVRNPLSAISYSTSLLLEESKNPAHTRLLSIVADNVTRLNRMIEDILRLSRKAHRPDEPLALAPVFDAILAEFCETHAVSPELIRVSPIGAQRIWFDGMHLQEVLLNLLSNALRYASGRAGSIRIDIALVSAARLELHVQDDGAAISPQIRAHLFEPFYTTSSRGTGLGLYLARELCLNNGAVLDYEYRVDPLESVAAGCGDLIRPVASSGRFVITFVNAEPA